MSQLKGGLSEKELQKPRERMSMSLRFFEYCGKSIAGNRGYSVTSALCLTPWTAACQEAAVHGIFSRARILELAFPTPEDLLTQGSESPSLHLLCLL